MGLEDADTNSKGSVAEKRTHQSRRPPRREIGTAKLGRKKGQGNLTTNRPDQQKLHQDGGQEVGICSKKKVAHRDADAKDCPNKRKRITGHDQWRLKHQPPARQRKKKTQLQKGRMRHGLPTGETSLGRGWGERPTKRKSHQERRNGRSTPIRNYWDARPG